MTITRKLNRSLLLGSLALAAAGLVSQPISGQAQDQDKGATKLMWSKPVKTAAAIESRQPGEAAAMSCPKCQDTQATVVEMSFKAVTPEVKRTATAHLCSGCTTKIVPHGGKQEAKVVHVCKSSSSEKATCCATNPGAAHTEGMAK